MEKWKEVGCRNAESASERGMNIDARRDPDINLRGLEKT